jgi:hypothetical protein
MRCQDGRRSLFKYAILKSQSTLDKQRTSNPRPSTNIRMACAFAMSSGPPNGCTGNVPIRPLIDPRSSTCESSSHFLFVETRLQKVAKRSIRHNCAQIRGCS